ncbi:TIGR02466 family protein [Sphingomonas sp. KR1UV-12]|uniref:TIGR02466 family protein n=1 Tax=Sphingomonas aurea TaxID=3063994 RepID=A0ABT9EJ33_9SPHN|nr:TIGR02466 family protein [Sphingomonas sp. KR1UV-12]MDP1026955.1 TIGR02466 family protein [Sphingomonas sp. KR1UV-12]
MTSARLATLFPTPVYTIGVPNAADLNAQLAGAIEAQRRRAQGVSKSNVGGWQSTADMIEWGGIGARTLADACIAAAARVTADPRGNPAAVRWQPEMWANINRKGDSNQSHWHPGSYLSFVYYVDDGYRGSGDRSLGGELVFIDPRMPFLRMRTPDLRHRTPTGTIEEQETWIRPFSGLLIAFPSFLPHSVRPYDGDGTRLSIAINLVARPA